MKRHLLLTMIVALTMQIISGQQAESYELDIQGKPSFYSHTGIKPADTFSIEFNIYRDKGVDGKERIRVIDTSIIDLELFEFKDKEGKTPDKAPIYLPGSFEILHKGEGKSEVRSDITVSLLIDRSGSLSDAEMERIKEAVWSFVEKVPDGCVFFSWFHSHVSTSIPISKTNFNQAELTRTPFHTDLYNAILIKLREFDKDAPLENAALEPDYEKIPDIYLRDSLSSANYLIVLTDGVNDIDLIPKYSNPYYKKITEDYLLSEIEKYKGKVKIYTLGFDAQQGNFDEELLRKISQTSGVENGYLFASPESSGPESVIEVFKTTLIEEIAVDFKAVFVNPPSKIYDGFPRKLTVTLSSKVNENEFVATGNTIISIGSKEKSIVTGQTAAPTTVNIFYGIITGIIVLLIVLIIIQLILPLIKNQVFNIKYVKKYLPTSNEVKKVCPYCFDEIVEGSQAVIKCDHIVHKDCWAKCGYMCPEFGQNCTAGKQDYFDITDPFSTRNKVYYVRWVMYGLIGGLLTWIIFELSKYSTLFDGISGKMVAWFAPSQIERATEFIEKIAPQFFIGILMGFFLSLFFAYSEEYRKKNFIVLFRILLRGVIGGIIGFLSFFAGRIIILLIYGEPYTNPWVDWIPWLIFGAAIGLSISIKTTIFWKHGLIGGIISILGSFLILYSLHGSLLQQGLVVCMMLYGAGLGFSIATVRSTAEQYFLKILNGSKQGNLIAVHKWMSAQGGLNEVYIGRSNVCEIQMNWEKVYEVGDKHAKLYINKSRNMPVLVSLTKGKSTLYDERLDMQAGKEYDLLNGVTFKIGETVFQYVEKDN